MRERNLLIITLFLLFISLVNSFQTNIYRFKFNINKLYVKQDSTNESDSIDFDSNEYRVASIKSAAISTLGGVLGSLPIAAAIGYYDHFSPQWEFSHDSLAVSLFLYGVVYRYAVRNDVNPQLKTGVIGAFAIVRALNMVDVPSFCTPIPLNCGPPFYYFDYSMISIGLINLFESLVAFGAASYAIEWATKNNVISKAD